MLVSLGPSDFAYLHRECPRCSFLKLRVGHYRPNSSMSNLFRTADRDWRERMDGKRTEGAFDVALPPGTLLTTAKKVESQIRTRPDGMSWRIKGIPDALIEFDDGSWGVLDLKVTGQGRASLASTYAPQLHAYALCLQDAGRSVTHLGIVAARISLYEPSTFEQVSVPLDFRGFLAQVAEVLDRVAGPLPDADPECSYCAYRDRPLPTLHAREVGGVREYLTADEGRARVAAPSVQGAGVTPAPPAAPKPKKTDKPSTYIKPQWGR